MLKYYDWQLEELYCAADRMADLARALYEEYGHDRCAVSRIIGSDTLAFVGFRALDRAGTGRNILEDVSIAKIRRLIFPYPGPRKT